MPQVPMMIPDGREIRARRLRLGLRPKQVADRIGRHVQTIRKLETGNPAAVSESLMYQVAIALGAEIEDIAKRPAPAASTQPVAHETAA
jgi:transcriptional regulator with XRE-family HTH domain